MLLGVVFFYQGQLGGYPDSCVLWFFPHCCEEEGEELCGGDGFVLYPGGEDGGGELGERFGADGAAQGEVGPRVAGGDEPEVALPGLRLDVELKAELAASQSHGLPEQGAANHGVGKEVKHSVGGTAEEGFQHGEVLVCGE